MNPKSETEQYLTILSISHFGVAFFTALVASFPLIHLTAGVLILVDALNSGWPVEWVGQIFVSVFFIVIALTLILVGWATAIAIALAGVFLARRSHHTYCLVVAGVECTIVPIGTVLGVLTLLLLLRPEVKAVFERPAPALEPPPLPAE